LEYQPKTEKDLAGMVCYQSERFHYIFGLTKAGKETFLVLERTERGRSTTIASVKVDGKMPIHLQIDADGDDYRFNYSYDGENFENLGGTVSGDILSTNVAGGFIGNFIGLYATSGNDVLVNQ
jgi:alpha-N-arabinofuranosidase